MKTALVCGATGLVGSALSARLRSDPDYSLVKLLTRREGSTLRAGTCVEVMVDFDDLEESASDLVADTVFCTFGSTIKKAGTRERFRQIDFDYPLRLAKIARSNDAQVFVLVSSAGASSKSSVFYSRVKGELEEGIAALDWPSLTIIRPSVIGGVREESRPAERLGQRVLRWAPLAFRTIPAGVIAEAMIRAAALEAPGTVLYESKALWGLAGSVE